MNDLIEFDGLEERIGGVPLVGGLLTGILSFCVGYLSFVGIAAGTGEGIDFEARPLRIVGQLFYNSILVPTKNHAEVSIEQQTETGTVLQEVKVNWWYNPFIDSDTVERQEQLFLDGELQDEARTTLSTEFAQNLRLTELSFPDFVYLAVPVIVLIGLGFLFAYRFISLDGVTEWKDVASRGFIGGGTIALGFLLMTLVGTYVFTVDGAALIVNETGEASFTRPDRVDSLLYGLLYPAVCGTTGVLLGQILQGPDIDSTRDDQLTVVEGLEEGTPEPTETSDTDADTVDADTDASDTDADTVGTDAEDRGMDSGTSGEDGETEEGDGEPGEGDDEPGDGDGEKEEGVTETDEAETGSEER